MMKIHDRLAAVAVAARERWRDHLRIRILIGCGLAGALALSAAAASGAPQPAPSPDCQTEGPLTPICGFVGPEDLEPLPGAKAMLVSARRNMNRPAPLSLLVLRTNERRVLYEGGPAAKPMPGWGDPACPGELAEGFSPHGISLRRRSDGTLMLAVVQHGAGRESVELFEVTGAGEDWRVAWRGCVIGLPGSSFNDVSLFADGGFVVSHVGSATRPAAVYAWRRKTGFSEVPGSQGGYPNGVLLGPGDRQVVVDYSTDNAVRLIDLESGRTVAKAAVPSPDNASWAPDGRLLVASVDMATGPTFPECFALPHGACPKRYRIMSYDGHLGDARVLHEGGGPLMGAASVGVIVQHWLFVGAAVGDRVLRVDLAGRH